MNEKILEWLAWTPVIVFMLTNVIEHAVLTYRRLKEDKEK